MNKAKSLDFSIFDFTMEKLSAVIITYNEEKNIGRCIRSLDGIVDEIVVLDSFSTDRTEEVCKKYKVKFFTHKFSGYIEQKNKAITYATYPLVLSLDADEELSESLKASILQAKNNWDADGYTMNRLTNYCGKWIYHCGWYPDSKLRLFDIRKGRWAGLNPHDRFVMNKGAKVKHLKGNLLHYSYYSVSQHYEHIKTFSSIWAEAKLKKGSKTPFFRVWGSPAIRFLNCYFIQFGFLEGIAGWRICTISTKESYEKYRKLRELLRQQRSQH